MAANSSFVFPENTVRYSPITKKIHAKREFAATATIDELKTFFNWVYEISKTQGIKHIVFLYYIPFDLHVLPNEVALQDAKVQLLVNCITNLHDPCLRIDFDSMPRQSRHYLEIVKALSYKRNVRGLSLPNHSSQTLDVEIVNDIRSTVIQMMQTNQLIYLNLGLYSSNDRSYFNMNNQTLKDAFARNPSIRQMDISAAYYEKVCKRNRNYHHKVTSLLSGIGSFESRYESSDDSSDDLIHYMMPVSYDNSEMLCGLYARIQRHLVEIMPTEPAPEKFKETPW